MGDNDRDRVRESERTTIVTTDGGGRGGGTIIAVVLVVVLLVVLFFLFGDRFRETAEEGPSDLDVSVNVDAPDVRLPDIEVRQADESPPATEQPPANQTGNRN